MNIETIKNLVNQLNDILADYDAKALESKIASIPRRRLSMNAVQKTECKTSIEFWNKRIDEAGGRSWFDLLTCNSDSMIAEKLEKQEMAKIKKRNSNFAMKLEKAGVSSVESFEGSDSNEGFFGNWKISTDKGMKNLKIQVIIAGGWIQCYHYRVLIHIK